MTDPVVDPLLVKPPQTTIELPSTMAAARVRAVTRRMGDWATATWTTSAEGTCAGAVLGTAGGAVSTAGDGAGDSTVTVRATDVATGVGEIGVRDGGPPQAARRNTAASAAVADR